MNSMNIIITQYCLIPLIIISMHHTIYFLISDNHPLHLYTQLYSILGDRTKEFQERLSVMKTLMDDDCKDVTRQAFSSRDQTLLVVNKISMDWVTKLA